MEYADYEFYKTSFFGNVVPESDFMRFAERASDFIDTLTFDRLVDGLPGDERQQKRIKKAVCAAADILYQIDIAEQNAAAAVATGTATALPGGGTTTGIVTSVSSVRYMPPPEMCGKRMTYS